MAWRLSFLLHLAPLPLLAAAPENPAVTIARYCSGCHNSKYKSGGLSLDPAEAASPGRQPGVWEKVVRRMRARHMPPAGAPRPDEATYNSVVAALESALDEAAAARPDPGRTDTFRRLNRIEYQNAVRDLLAVDVDVTPLLPADEASHGFDNVTVGDLSPMLLERYLNAARKISRLAIGIAGRSPGGDTMTLPPDLTQEAHFEGQPLGTRGGGVFHHTFPVDGVYEIVLRLARDRNEHVEGMYTPRMHEVDLIVDGEPVKRFAVEPPPGKDHSNVDRGLHVRLPIKAGPHSIRVAFPRLFGSLLETERQPYQAHFNMDRHPRLTPALYSITINGPYEAAGPGDTPSRKRIFVCRPEGAADEAPCAERILTTLARRAYRRPVAAGEIARPLEFFRQARAAGNFDSAIETALRAILVSPEFLFRVERDPEQAAPGAAYRITDLELASRLSFFLWSSIPDDPLLADAEAGRLREPAVLAGHVRRMLADARSESLITNFAGQWLHLRNLSSIAPDMRLFPDFDDNLRQSFRRETELFLGEILREDKPVTGLLKADYTYLNERLARHYGIPNVYGSRFRRVVFPDGDRTRGGLLRHGSILTVTSYATRTSPVIRGKWILENLLGVPPPAPPPNTPALKERDSSSAQFTSMRERLAQHRANPACFSCHQLMDPVGFSLENYDAVGRWRTTESGVPVDTAGGLPDGSSFNGAAGLEDALLARPELFASTFAEKLLTYALGRGIESCDAPAVRKIVRESRAAGYRFSSFIIGVVSSVPFQMRRSP